MNLTAYPTNAKYTKTFNKTCLKTQHNQAKGPANLFLMPPLAAGLLGHTLPLLLLEVTLVLPDTGFQRRGLCSWGGGERVAQDQRWVCTKAKHNCVNTDCKQGADLSRRSQT